MERKESTLSSAPELENQIVPTSVVSEEWFWSSVV